MFPSEFEDVTSVTMIAMTDMKKATVEVSVAIWIPTLYPRICIAPPKTVRSDTSIRVMGMATEAWLLGPVNPEIAV